MTTLWKAMAIAVLTAVLTGCSGAKAGQVKTVDLNAQAMTFDQKFITISKGQTIRVVLHNQDSVLHDFSIDKIPAKVNESHDGGHHDMGVAKMPDLHTSAEAGATGEVEFTASKAGTYLFYCTVLGHKDAGMQGKLVVQ